MAWQAGVRGEEGDRIGGEWITWGIANKSVKYCPSQESRRFNVLLSLSRGFFALD